MRSDADLLGAWRAGDERAGAELFGRYFEPVRRFFINKLCEEPDDLVQETFIACLRGRERLRDTTAFRSYLFGTACNLLRAHLRRRTHVPLTESDERSAFDLSPGPSTAQHAREGERLLLDALRRIPLGMQIVLELHYWESMKTAEIAEVLELPAATVRRRLQRGRERLLEVLDELPMDRAMHATLSLELDQWATELRSVVVRSEG